MRESWREYRDYAWGEFRAGWEETRWQWPWTLAMAATTFLLMMLVGAIEGKVSDPPSLLFWVLATPAALYWLWVFKYRKPP